MRKCRRIDVCYRVKVEGVGEARWGCARDPENLLVGDERRDGELQPDGLARFSVLRVCAYTEN